MMPKFIGAEARPQHLPLIVKAWEDALGLPEVRYTFPKLPVGEGTHYFAWIRWAKECIGFLGNEAPLHPVFT
jgi:hypothetical protein